MQDNKLTNVVRAYCGAYQAADREAAEALLAEDFSFTSPNDDGIDKATYFERCWPDGDAADEQRIENIVIEGERAFVTYSCFAANGTSFRNTEFLTFIGERIASINVYFGPAWRNGVLV